MCDNARYAVDSGLARIGKDINKLLKKIRNSTNVPIYQPYIQFFPLRVVLCQESSWRLRVTIQRMDDIGTKS